MAKDRFKRVYSQGVLEFVEIWVDRETGVNYMYRMDTHAGGLTVMVDQNGKPLATPVD